MSYLKNSLRNPARISSIVSPGTISHAAGVEQVSAAPKRNLL